MLEWMANHRTLLWLAGVASLAIFVASAVVIPALIVRIRPDYFAHAVRPPGRWAHKARAVQIGMVIGKNALGAVLMVAGLAMLVLPGQGLLTLLVGFLLIDFPGKYRFEKWLIGRRFILRPINWLRRRRNRAPLQVSPLAE